MADLKLTWRKARGQGNKFANGPRVVANHKRCVLEVVEWCSTKKGNTEPCPSGQWTYAITKGSNTVIAGPHGGTRDLHTSPKDAQIAAERRVYRDPRAVQRCRR